MQIGLKSFARGFVLAAAAALLVAGPALAETTRQAENSERVPAPQAENQPQQLQLCVRENPAIDYRACVNATTRNRAAKIRQA